MRQKYTKCMDEIKDDNLEKYIKYSIEELETLKESYIEKINECVDNHWITKLQKNVKFDLFRYIFIFSLGLFIIGILLVIALIILFWDRYELIMDIPFLIILIIVPIFIGGVLLQSLNDGSRIYRIDLRNIDLILKKKKLLPNKKIMLDSNIFDDIINNIIRKEDFEAAKKLGYIFFITHIQTDEINDCKDDEKRKKLTLFLATISPTVIPTESLVFGVSRMGYSKLSDGEKLTKLTKGSQSLKKSKDGLIGETVIKQKLTLLSNDKQLLNRVRNEGGEAITINDFKMIIK